MFALMPLCETKEYIVQTRYTESKILVNVGDGEKALIRHKAIIAIFNYKKTNEKIMFRGTGKGLWYEDGKEISEYDVKQEFKRLLDSNWELYFKTMNMRLVLGT